MITIEINSDTISAALTSALTALGDLRPIMDDIGEYMTKATKDRFGRGEAPDGSKWVANSPATLARKKDTRPLFGETGMLSSQISHEAGSDFVEIGSNRIQAAMMQFGGTKAAFPHLFGDIPARPFIGVSAEDEANILDIISEALGSALTP